MKRAIAARLLTLFTVCVLIGWALPARAQWQIDSKDGKTNVRIGFLAQPQLELLETPDTTQTSRNVFLRRFRILFGGKVSDSWTFFFETDSPNLGKANPDRTANPTGAKDSVTSNAIYIQDAFFTYNHGDEFKVDAGLLLTPLGHNHNQSAASLLPVDYSPYTFTESGPLQERVGRDTGVQLRGYPFKQHLEYRLGVFQGIRGVEATNELRVAGRAVWYPFAADTGFFYSGTFQGQKRVVGIGAAFDHQKDYSAYSADAFVDQPINKGEQGFTAQFDWMRFDGGTFLASLPKQDTYLIEAAFHFMKGQVSPLVQYSHRSFANPLTPSQSVWQAGAAYWMAGHQRNIKFTAGRQHVDNQPDRTQVLVQLQIFYY